MMKQIEQASPYTLDTISREQIIQSGVIPSATLSRYVKLLLEFSNGATPKQATQNALNDLAAKIGGLTASTAPTEQAADLGFISGCTIYTPLQVFTLCWVKYCSSERKERSATIRVRLQNKEPQFLFLNKVDHPAHIIFRQILNHIEANKEPKQVQTELA